MTKGFIMSEIDSYNFLSIELKPDFLRYLPNDFDKKKKG